MGSGAVVATHDRNQRVAITKEEKTAKRRKINGSS
jgi:hypothetical protein